MKYNLDRGDTRLIIQEATKHNILRNQLAYILATTYWETARTMKPVREYGGEKYLKSKKYYPFVGMGYVQLTWEENYKKAGEILGVDFIADPKLLLKPEYAVTILVVGMKEGWFTGKKLSDYMTLQKSDFLNARRMINRMDKASTFQQTAKEFDKLLKADGYGVEKAPEVPHSPVEKVKVLTKPKRSKLPQLGLFALLAYLYFEYKEMIDAFIASFIR